MDSLKERPPVFTGSLDEEDTTNVLMFLVASRPLTGCDYSDNERFEHGQQLVTEWAALQQNILIGTVEAPALPIEGQANPADLYECANVLYFLSNIEARPGFRLDDGASVAVGRTLVYDWIRTRLELASGTYSEQPHNTEPRGLIALCERLEAERDQREIAVARCS